MFSPSIFNFLSYLFCYPNYAQLYLCSCILFLAFIISFLLSKRTNLQPNLSGAQDHQLLTIKMYTLQYLPVQIHRCFFSKQQALWHYG